MDKTNSVEELDCLEETSKEVPPLEVRNGDLRVSIELMQIAVIVLHHQHRFVLEKSDMSHERFHNAVQHLISFCGPGTFVNEVQVSDFFLEAASDTAPVLPFQTPRHLHTQVLGCPRPYTCFIGHPETSVTNSWAKH